MVKFDIAQSFRQIDVMKSTIQELEKEGANINSIVICKSKLLAAENKLEEAIQFFSKHIQFFTDQSKNTFCERLQSHYTFNS